jgi:hypothetical protein
MENFIQKWPLISEIIVYVIGFNALLAGIKIALDKIKDVTASSWDNKASELLGKVISFVQKLIDIIGNNPKH